MTGNPGRHLATALLVFALASLASCGTGVTSTPSASAGTHDHNGTRTRSPAPRPTAPTFTFDIEPLSHALRARMLSVGTWRPGCPVALGDLCLLSVSHWGFDGQARRGRLVVHRRAAPALARAFRSLFAARFPIRRMVLIENYGGSDDRSMAADNTSAFNGRYVSGAPGVWSQHAYGLAIDINPVENPYVSGSHVSPPAGRAYADRRLRAPGMIHTGDTVVRAFTGIGWKWGGTWRDAKDYQHFSWNGR